MDAAPEMMETGQGSSTGYVTTRKVVGVSYRYDSVTRRGWGWDN